MGVTATFAQKKNKKKDGAAGTRSVSPDDDEDFDWLINKIKLIFT